MRTKTLAALLLPAALAVAARPAQALSVTTVTLAVSPVHSKGPCPAVFKFEGKVTLNGEGRFTYKWERSDGAIDSTAPHAASYNGSTPTIVTETWTLGAPGAPFHPFHGWVRLHVLTPTDKSSNEAKFLLDCGPGNNPAGGPGGNPNGPPTQRCDGKPDLVPELHTPMDGWVAVKNIGTGVAGPSVLSIKCQRVGYAAGGGCADIPASLITPPFFALPGALGVRVPELYCGKEFVATMPWWGQVTWAKGTYQFTATADSTNVIAESNEGNNTTSSSMTR